MMSLEFFDAFTMYWGKITIRPALYAIVYTDVIYSEVIHCIL